jgi:hypothetical protein
MMQHGDIRTFLNHYLQRRVSADTQAIRRGLEPQNAMMRAACTMSRWIDPDRPWHLTTEQSSSVNNDSHIISLIKRRERLKRKLQAKCRGTDDPTYIKLNRQIVNEKQRLRHALLIHIQEMYDKEQPVRDIERQLSGVKIGEAPSTASYISEDTLPEQKRLIEAVILAPPGTTYEEEVERRNSAINAVTRYCQIEEGQTCRRQKRSTGQAKPVVIKKEEDTQLMIIDPQAKALEAAMLSVFTEKRPTICVFCLSNESLPLDARIYAFGTSGDLSKHCRRKHLKNIKEGEKIRCEICKMSLDNKMHLQRHLMEIHGTVT